MIRFLVGILCATVSAWAVTTDVAAGPEDEGKLSSYVYER